MRRSRLIRSCLCLAAGWVAAPGHAMDLPGLMGRADTAVNATVFLVPPMALFRSSLDEARMQSSACRYYTTDPAAIRALVALLKAAGVNAASVYQKPDMREGVYLTLPDGAQLKLLLQDNPGSRLPVNGVAESINGGDLQSVAMTASASMSSDIRAWAASRGGVGAGTACERLVPPPVAPDTRTP